MYLRVKSAYTNPHPPPVGVTAVVAVNFRFLDVVVVAAVAVFFVALAALAAI